MLPSYLSDTNLDSIKLVATDMDLTLLADDKSMPAGVDERIDALVHAGGHGFIVREQGEVHVCGDELDRVQVGVGEIRGKHRVLSFRVVARLTLSAGIATGLPA